MSIPESENLVSQVTGDRLSSLPDELLHHVMSFLPTWQAVQMCLLSRRWKTLWTTMPNLNIDFCNLWNMELYNSRTSTTRILKFVSTVLLLHETPFSLHTFRLNCHLHLIMGGYWLSRSIGSWIRYAVKHNLQALIINIIGNDKILLPSEVFTSPSLQHVKFSFSGPVDTPEIINLPSLKHLHLEHAEFTQDFVIKLLRGCPVLEDLHLKFCFKEFSNIISHSLKHLTITTDNIFGSIELIDSPNLLSFHLRMFSCCLKNETILNMPSLSKACIEIHNCSACDRGVIKSNILCGLFNVHCLELRGTSMQGFLEAEISSCKTFSKLTCLSVDNVCLDCRFDLLSSLLEHCPNLKKLSIVYRCCICKKQSMQCKDKTEMKFKCEQLGTVEIKFLVEHGTPHSVVKNLQEAFTGLGNVCIIMTSAARPLP